MRSAAQFSANLQQVALRRPGVFFALAAVASWSGCTRVESAKPAPGVTVSDPGGPGASSGGSSSSADAGAPGTNDPVGSSGGAPTTLEIGLFPTFVSDPATNPDAQAVLASVAALSLGAETLPVAARWDELSGATGSPRAARWAGLDSAFAPYRDRAGNLALCIGIVDRQTAAWPLSGELDFETASLAMERTIDEVYRRYSASLSHLCFGYQLDRYLRQASAGQEAQLFQLLEHAVSYAGSHPRRVTAQTSIGVALSLDVLASGDAKWQRWLLGDEAVAVYDPLADDASLKAPGSVADELAAAVDMLPEVDGRKLQLSLFEIGYPSGRSAGSSEDAQLEFYQALFGALDTRLDQVRFVGAYGLADRELNDCQAEAAVFGGSQATQAERALVRCSMGLRAEGTPPAQKLAFASLMTALSRFRR